MIIYAWQPQNRDLHRRYVTLKLLAHGSGRFEEDQKETEALDPVIRNQSEHRQQILPEREPGDAQWISPLIGSGRGMRASHC